MPRAIRTLATLQLEGLPAIHPKAAGIDIGADEIVVAVPADRDTEPVRAFRTFTADLQEVVAWLVACGIDTVALESTGVYWIPIYELLEQLQKALQQMNIQLERVLSDIMGVTGQAIVRAIVEGERDPVTLAQYRNAACKSSEETIAKALTGTWDEELLVVLEQSLALYDAYSAQITVCDRRIASVLAAMEGRGRPDAPLPDLPPAKADSKSKNAPHPQTRAQFARLLDVDLVAVMGLSASGVQTIVSEIGTDMTRFPSVKHFCSWLGLAPHNDISGGKVLRSRRGKVVNRAAQAFRQAAQSVSRSNSAIGAYYRTMRSRKGPQQATVATAHKIARIVYHMLTYGKAYQAESAEVYEQQRQERELRALARRAKKLGYRLTQAQELP